MRPDSTGASAEPGRQVLATRRDRRVQAWCLTAVGAGHLLLAGWLMRPTSPHPGTTLQVRLVAAPAVSPADSPAAQSGALATSGSHEAAQRQAQALSSPPAGASRRSSVAPRLEAAPLAPGVSPPTAPSPVPGAPPVAAAVPATVAPQSLASASTAAQPPVNPNVLSAGAATVPMGSPAGNASPDRRQDSGEPVEWQGSAIAYRVQPVLTFPDGEDLGEYGTVTLRVLVDEQGRPTEVKVQRSSGHYRLDRHAARVMRQALFEPQKVNDQARKAWAVVNLHFNPPKP